MLARRYKRGVLCIVGWPQRRVWLTMADWPWRLYALADDQRMLECEPLVDKFFSTGACCKPAGLARDLQEGGASKQELLGGQNPSGQSSKRRRQRHTANPHSTPSK